MGVTALVGCQWGDEGKGKIADILSARVDAVARYQGGANAGHTVVIGDTTHILHLIPAGILRPGVTCLLGNGMAIDPEAFLIELDTIRQANIDVDGRLFMSPRAHLILPDHKAVDTHREATSDRPIGTTLRGIGPAYETKALRTGLRVGDLYRPERRDQALRGIREWALCVGCEPTSLQPMDQVRETLDAQAESFRPFIREVRRMVTNLITTGRELLLEGAQGVLLDLDHGTYPFVTSSNPSTGGAVVGLGMPATTLSSVVGIVKAYTTRVGEGPFPTELLGASAEAIRSRGAEFGATTGRPRRCGWLDGVLLRYAVEVNGVTALVVTKLDVLDGEETLRIATSYEGAPDPVLEDPIDTLDQCKPVYEEMPGWSGTVGNAKTWSDLPENAQRYVERIAEIAGVPIAMVSTGSRRDKIIHVREDLLPPLRD